MSSFTEIISVPLITIFKNGVTDPKSFLGKSLMYRNLFADHYILYNTEMNITLEKMELSKKNELWEESLKYCPSDRLKWCQAWRFYQAL